MKRPLEEQQGALVWFRSDLRLHDNKALTEAIQYAKVKNLHMEAIYVFSIQELEAMNIGPVRVDFISRTLKCLQKDLASIGIKLSIEVIPRTADYAEFLADYCNQNGLGSVFFNKEFDPVAMARDEKVKKSLSEKHIGFQDFVDQCIVQEGFVLTKMGKPYGMFTPFKNTWLQYLKENPVTVLEKPEPYGPSLTIKDRTVVVEGYELSLHKELDIKEILEQFPAGEDAAIEKLTLFVTEKGKGYKDLRNFPSVAGTSKISPYLSIGAISPRQAFELARQANHGATSSGSEGLQTYISELCWRDFYRHIMYHFPRVARGDSFKPEAGNIEWRDGNEAEKEFERWCQGKTGFPIVDAAMNQLSTTGWMHNRLRMIVSMFLTKHLLISWKKGEQWFSRHLIDYDFPSNNGGWQWSASTGTDSQPYFRIFNPFTQSENFDKDGIFIKKFLPELASVPTKAIHNPNGLLSVSEKQKLCPGYPPLIVEHVFARQRALAAFAKAFKKV